MSSLRRDIPRVDTLSDARIFIEELIDTIGQYGRVLGTVLPALEAHPELKLLVKNRLEP